MCLKACGDHLRSIKRVLETLWEMSKEYWRPFQQPLSSSGYTLGNAQIEVETCWEWRPAGSISQRVSSKPPQPIAHRVSAYIRHVLLIYKKHGGFIKPN
jgi:hypothetical protein